MAFDETLKVGEKKTIQIQYANSLDISGATMSFSAKRQIGDSTALITVADAAFDDTNEATGLTAFDLTVTSAMVGTLIGECTATFSATNVDVSEYITIWVKDQL